MHTYENKKYDKQNVQIIYSIILSEFIKKNILFFSLHTSRIYFHISTIYKHTHTNIHIDKKVYIYIYIYIYI